MSNSRLADLWDEKHAATLDEPGLLQYRSNLLGSDLRITNFGGGNTSAKVTTPDPLTQAAAEVLWVKGSGGDLGSMGRDGFATLYMDKLNSLQGIYRGLEMEDEMVGLLSHCTFNLNPRAASIDTPLHAFVPARHVDHMHPDAVIAIAAARHSEKLTAQVFGAEMGWLPWQRPGFDLGLKLGAMATANLKLVGVVLGGHGVFTWGETARDSYVTTLRILQKAADWLAENERKPVFQGARFQPLAAADRAAVAAKLMPAIRGKISDKVSMVGHFTDAAEVLDFVNSTAIDDLAPLGTSCPDHFLRTKIRPLVLPAMAKPADADAVLANLDGLLSGYRADYAAYYDRCKRPNSPAMRDPNAVIYLVPAVGMLSFARDKATARIAAEYYTNAINVMRGASGVDAYTGLPEQEAFDIEYWLLEEAKLQRMPKAKSLAGRTAFVTGGAGGIGRAIATRLMGEGASVVLADIDAASLESTVAEFRKGYGRDAAHGVICDVTDEPAVDRAMAEAVRACGGIDILVSNAGFASAAAFEDTSLELWNKNMSVLATGYFLVSRAAFRVMKAQGRGGSIIFIASKNGLAASAGASALAVQ